MAAHKDTVAALRDAFQGGKDDVMLDILYGSGDWDGPGALMQLDHLLQDGSERALTFSIPQIAALIERLAAVDGKA